MYSLGLLTSRHSFVVAQALTSMLEEAIDQSLARKATLLMGEVLQIANKILPLSVASKIQVQSVFDNCSFPHVDRFC